MTLLVKVTLVTVPRNKLDEKRKKGSLASPERLSPTGAVDRILKYRGAEERLIFRWFVELGDAIRDRGIVVKEMRVALSQSNLEVSG